MRSDPLEAVRQRKRLDEAGECLLAGRLDEARSIYDDVLADFPDHPVALHGLGLLLVHQGQFQAGEQNLRRAIEQTPDNPRYWNDLGEALRLQGRIEEAMTAYRKCLELDAGFVPAMNNLGVTLLHAGDIGAAEAQFTRVFELTENDPYAYNNLGVLRQQQGKLEDALMAYEAAVRLKPDFAEALANYTDLVQAHPGFLKGSIHRLASLLGKPMPERAAGLVGTDAEGKF